MDRSNAGSCQLSEYQRKMSIFKALKTALIRSAEKSGRMRTRRVLLNMSERQLRDFGFSKQLLLQGESGWPWRENAEPQMAKIPAVAVVQQDRRALKQAMNELHSFSDRELAELGVSRHSIKDVVLHGRPDIEGESGNLKSAA